MIDNTLTAIPGQLSKNLSSAEITNLLAQKIGTGIQPLIDNSMYEFNGGYDPYKKFGPPPRQNPSPKSYIEEYMKVVHKKNHFEELIDGIFSTTEKEQFLMDVGYELEWDNQDGSHTIYKKNSDGTRRLIVESFNDTFMKEILIKFKITLLSKSTLKLKI